MGGRDGSRLGPVRVPRTRKGRTLRSKKLLATAGVLTLVLPVSVATADETGGESGIGGLAVPAPDGEISPDAAQEFFESQSKSTVMVELQGDPVAVTEAKTEGSLSEAQEKDIESKLESDQGQVAKAIEAKGGQVEGQMQSAFNGMRVTIDNNELESLRSVPGVKAVHSIPVYDRSITASVPSLGVPKIWDGYGGSTSYTGEDVKVALRTPTRSRRQQTLRTNPTQLGMDPMRRTSRVASISSVTTTTARTSRSPTTTPSTARSRDTEPTSPPRSGEAASSLTARRIRAPTTRRPTRTSSRWVRASPPRPISTPHGSSDARDIRPSYRRPLTGL